MIGGLVLAAYGNLFNLLVERLPASRRGWAGVAGPVALLCGVMGWHCRVERSPLVALGLHRQDWRRGLIWGTLAGAALALPPVVWFRRPRRGGARLRFDEVHGIGRRAFLVRLFVTTPLLVAFVEEVAFRGFLQGRMVRGAVPPRAAVALSSLSFALWHVTVNLFTLRRTNVLGGRLLPLPLALAGGLASVFAGGVVFGSLYQRTGSLAAPVAAHWVVDALMLLALYAAPKAGGDTVTIVRDS